MVYPQKFRRRERAFEQDDLAGTRPNKHVFHVAALDRGESAGNAGDNSDLGLEGRIGQKPADELLIHEHGGAFMENRAVLDRIQKLLFRVQLRRLLNGGSAALHERHLAAAVGDYHGGRLLYHKPSAALIDGGVSRADAYH